MKLPANKKSLLEYVPAPDECVDDEYILKQNPDIRIQDATLYAECYCLNYWNESEGASYPKGSFSTLQQALDAALDLQRSLTANEPVDNHAEYLKEQGASSGAIAWIQKRS